MFLAAKDFNFQGAQEAMGLLVYSGLPSVTDVFRFDQRFVVNPAHSVVCPDQSFENKVLVSID